MRSVTLKFLYSFFIVIFFISCSKDDKPAEPEKPAPVTEPDWAEAADRAQASLDAQFYSTSQHYYNQNNNGHTGFNYWWNAHAMDVKIDAFNRTRDQKYVRQMKELLEGCYAKNGNTLWNTFYDDMEWWALACLRAYEATGDEAYKTAAQQYWDWIKGGWSDVKQGGIAWATGSRDSKNACSNAPAAIIAARLYQLNKKQEDLDWALKIYGWMKSYLVESARGLVWDAYGNTKDENIYTYNQGTFAGAALELYKITRNQSYLNDATRNINYVMNDGTKFSPNGILKGENSGDGGLFKGVFIRYMIQIVIQGNLDDYTKGLYLKYLRNNGISLNKATLKPDNIFGNDWRTIPANNVCDASVHLSGTMLFEGLDELKRIGLLK
ncbi:glycoside hydrolase family 76 protein [Arcticibacter tournemirensis]